VVFFRTRKKEKEEKKDVYKQFGKEKQLQQPFIASD
jgi:hypothetical protein